jgi:hypothetical protein
LAPTRLVEREGHASRDSNSLDDNRSVNGTEIAPEFVSLGMTCPAIDPGRGQAVLGSLETDWQVFCIGAER